MGLAAPVLSWAAGQAATPSLQGKGPDLCLARGTLCGQEGRSLRQLAGMTLVPELPILEAVFVFLKTKDTYLRQPFPGPRRASVGNVFGRFLRGNLSPFSGVWLSLLGTDTVYLAEKTVLQEVSHNYGLREGPCQLFLVIGLEGRWFFCCSSLFSSEGQPSGAGGRCSPGAEPACPSAVSEAAGG